MIGKAFHYLQKGVYSGSQAVSVVGMIFIVILVLASVADVFMRFVFNMPVRGAGEISQLGLSVVVFTALAYCGVRGSHVAVDIVTSRLRKRAQQFLRIFMQFLSVAILGILAWQLFSYSSKMREVGQSSVMLAIPVYPFVFVSAVGTSLLALVFLVQFFVTIAEVKWR